MSRLAFTSTTACSAAEATLAWSAALSVLCRASGVLVTGAQAKAASAARARLSLSCMSCCATAAGTTGSDSPTDWPCKLWRTAATVLAASARAPGAQLPCARSGATDPSPKIAKRTKRRICARVTRKGNSGTGKTRPRTTKPGSTRIRVVSAFRSSLGCVALRELLDLLFCRGDCLSSLLRSIGNAFRRDDGNVRDPEEAEDVAQVLFL